MRERRRGLSVDPMACGIMASVRVLAFSIYQMTSVTKLKKLSIVDGAKEASSKTL